MTTTLLEKRRTRARRSPVTESKDDATLFAEFRDRADEAPLAALVARHWDRAYRIALGLVRDPATAEDVAQEAFFRLALAAKERRKIDPVRAWLASVVLNGARNAIRSRARRTRREREAAERRPEVTSMSVGGLDEYVAQLPDGLGLPIVLHYGLGLSHSEVGSFLGCPTGTVASRLRTGVGRLRESLERSGVATAASFALEGALAEAWAPVRAAPVPAAPRVARILARGSSAAGTWASRSLAKVVLPGAFGVALAAALLATGPWAKLGAGPGPAGAGPGAGPANGTAAVGTNQPASATSARSPAGVAGGPGAPGAGTPAPVTPTPSGTGRAGDSKGARLAASEAPPPYPWPGRVSPLAAVYGDRSLTLDVDEDLDRRDLVEVLNRLGLPPITIDPACPADLGPIGAVLRLEECSAVDVLTLGLGTGALRLVPSGNGACLVMKDLAPRASRAPLDGELEAGMGPPDPVLRDEVRAELDAPVSLDFDELPLGDALTRLESATKKVSLQRASGDGNERSRASLHVSGRPFREALATLLGSLGLHFEVVARTVVILPGRAAAPRVSGRLLDVDLRGATVPEVVAALEARGVRTIASKKLWASRGTVSLVAQGQPVEELLASLGPPGAVRRGSTHDEVNAVNNARDLDRLLAQRFGDRPPEHPATLVGWIAETEEGECVLLDGELPDVATALETPVPFAALEPKVAAARSRLRSLLEARETERAHPKATLASLRAAEKAVDAVAQEALDVLERATTLGCARAKARELVGRLEAARAERETLERERLRAGGALASLPAPAQGQAESAQRRDVRLASLVARTRAAGAAARVGKIERELARQSRLAAETDRLENGGAADEKGDGAGQGRR